MHSSPSKLPSEARVAVIGELNARLSDGIDLYTQVKVAHWNIRGPHFAALHPLFDTFADRLSEQNDTLAERAVTLGGRAHGTARHVAKTSTLTEYVADTTRDLEHVKLLVSRYGQHLDGLRASRTVAEQKGDIDTDDMLTQIISDLEKDAWFLHATLGE
ncbi:MAG: DNA starvation/stationary phase protection protein Dps [Labilithrix sp.]|nr:DNA starvation/stationary phase protection protein Dps [Labilithrix sp.]